MKPEIMKLYIRPIISFIERPNVNKFARNVALLDYRYYMKIADWVNQDEAEFPGMINNMELEAKIEDMHDISEHVDFIIVEKSVWTALYDFFQGGPAIFRPAIAHPRTKDVCVIIYPLKYIIYNSGKSVSLVIHPDWTFGEFFEYLAERYQFDMNLSKIYVPDTDTSFNMTDIIKDQKHLGTYLKLDTNKDPLFQENTLAFGLDEDVQQLKENFVVTNYVIYPLFFGFMSIISHSKLFYRLISDEISNEDSSKMNDSVRIVNHYIHQAKLKYYQSSLLEKFFKNLIYQHEELENLRHFEGYELIKAIMKSLFIKKESLDDISTTYSSTYLCPLCQYAHETFVSDTNLLLNIPKKTFGTPTIVDCIKSHFSGKQTEDSFFCERCNKKVTGIVSRVLETLPKLLIIDLFRFIRAESDYERSILSVQNLERFSINDSRNILIKYKLIGVVSHFGTPNKPKYKTVVKDELSNLWLFFNESRIRVLDEDDPFSKVPAQVLIYESE